MQEFLAYRISVGKSDYTTVFAKYPEHKQFIDAYLTERGQGNLIV